MTSVQPQIIPKFHDQPLTKTLGLISDTHVPVRAKEIPKRVFEIFNKVDYIIHAGDLVDLSVLDELEQAAPVLAVCGNMDGPQIRGKLPATNALKVLDWRIGVTHDPKTLFGMNKMREIAKKNNFNALVYGHTHCPNIKWEGATLFINPGSPTNPVGFSIKPSVALLQISKERITPTIVEV